jgi:ligand-binding sensor domain-containing protein
MTAPILPFTGIFPDDSTSLRANEVLALHEDKAGNLWIGTGGGGMSLYNRQKNTFEHFTFNNTGLKQ